MCRCKAPNLHYLRDTLQTDCYPVMYLEASGDHLRGNWRGLVDDMLVLIGGG
jgi:hypothetical protein